MKCYDLREANVARDKEWTGGEGVSHIWRSNELHGEVGEVGELFISTPSRMPPDAASDWLGRLADELADGLICVDLVGMKFGFPLISHDEPVDEHFARHFGEMANLSLIAVLGVKTGAVCNIAKKLDRAAEGWVGSKADPSLAWPPLFEVHCILRELARRYNLDPRRFVADKFNRTSEKNGLTTRLIA